MMRAAGKSWQHRRTKGDDSNDKAQPQASDVSSDKRCNDGAQEVAREYAAGKKWQGQLTLADGNLQGWQTGGTLPKGYVRNVPLPRVSLQQSPTSQVQHTIPDYYKLPYVAPTYTSPRSIVESAAYAFSPAWHAIAINT
jgi:hypothetical protein